MSDIPASITFDNLVSVALKELKAPLLLKIQDLKKQQEILEYQSIALDDKSVEANKTMFCKKHAKLFKALESLGRLEYEAHFYGLDVEFIPTTEGSSGSIRYSFTLNKNAESKMRKESKKIEAKIGKIKAQIISLKKQLEQLDGSIEGVKDFMMTQFLDSNPGHAEFKNYIRQKLNEGC